MINIFLDDERYPEDVTWVKLPEVDWHIVRTALDFKDLIVKQGVQNINYISFDHDIASFTEGGNETTGYDLIKWLCYEAQGNLIPQCFFHTNNQIGKRNMESYYINYLNFVDDKNQI